MSERYECWIVEFNNPEKGWSPSFLIDVAYKRQRDAERALLKGDLVFNSAKRADEYRVRKYVEAQ